MANSTLAQDEPYLKQLDKTLKEINKLHQGMHDAILSLEENMLEVYGLINVSWPKVTGSFITLECLKNNRRELNRHQDDID